MKHTVIFFILSTVCLDLVAQSEGELKITIEGIEEFKGSISVALYNSEADFLKKDYLNYHQPIDGEEIVISITGLPMGTYAVSIFHDINNNKKLDKHFYGLPKEPYGFGNNARGIFGPPSYEASSVVIREGVTEVSVEVN